MSITATSSHERAPDEHVGVLIIGAGISGIGAACQLTRQLPTTDYLVVEARDAIGGTWDLFRYPGIRSDSDMYTLGYSWRPWDRERSIADGATIRDYVVETAEEFGVTDHIRFQRRVVALSWDSVEARWTARVERTDGGPDEIVTADFVYGCTGYYRYDEGYTPDFDGTGDFAGTIVHPQHWPEDLDVEGRNVVVIGSGATAMTLVPALARQGAQVTMLQRSPTYVISLPGRDELANLLHRYLPASVAHSIIKWKNVLLSTALVRLSRTRPELVKKMLLKGVEERLPEHLDVEEHFTPRYDPWDQRLCLVPDADLFEALRSGNATVVTDTTERFVEDGVQVGSGDVLEADIIVTATGLNLLMMGGVTFTVDGEEVEVPETYTYKGMMLSGVPNFAFATGYTTASWTLKVDLVTDYVCRLLAHMEQHGYRQVTPMAPAPENRTGGSILDLDAGYIKRGQHVLPRQGTGYPWELHQSYRQDVALFRRGELDDDGVRFSQHGEVGRKATREALARARAGTDAHPDGSPSAAADSTPATERPDATAA